ncbi:CNKSR2 [Bugula neritina]|uniref:CNKSR2 n=1 Tax=Bugula neritina TaxID=10212 RepID=A0A7J7JGD2_BUGNE|nr:CNKSR2 [Bugula neritina]
MTLKIEKWDVEQVASWVKGLDSIICHYSKKFKANGIIGKQLLILDHHDLSKIGITKVGHQEAILESLELLLSILAEIESKCDDLVKRCPDSIILTPASLENITVRKRAGETLGLHLQSSQQGIHTIKLIRENTACDSISKLEPGDQIVQVNDQVVIGWQLSHVVDALKENPKEVSLKVRKPPRHFNPLSLNQRRPSPKNTLRLGEELKLKQSTFPKRASKHISEDGSFEGKIKSSSIGEAPANIHVTVDPSSPSAYDDVFSLASTIDSVSSSHAPFDTRNLETNRDEVEGGKALRPTILVNDVWHPENSSIAESQPLSGTATTATTATGTGTAITFTITASMCTISTMFTFTCKFDCFGSISYFYLSLALLLYQPARERSSVHSMLLNLLRSYELLKPKEKLPFLLLNSKILASENVTAAVRNTRN